MDRINLAGSYEHGNEHLGFVAEELLPSFASMDLVACVRTRLSREVSIFPRVFWVLKFPLRQTAGFYSWKTTRLAKPCQESGQRLVEQKSQKKIL
jgi:hypothetical protein